MAEIKHSGSSFNAEAAAKLTKEAFIAKHAQTHFQSFPEEKKKAKLAEIWQQCKDAADGAKPAATTGAAKPEPAPPAPAPKAEPAPEKAK